MKKKVNAKIENGHFKNVQNRKVNKSFEKTSLFHPL
jgi:hypothetical protein